MWLSKAGNDVHNVIPNTILTFLLNMFAPNICLH